MDPDGSPASRMLCRVVPLLQRESSAILTDLETYGVCVGTCGFGSCGVLVLPLQIARALP